MDFALFFDYPSEKSAALYQQDGTLGASTRFATAENIDKKQADIALLGVPPTPTQASNGNSTLYEKHFDDLRRIFYALSALSKPCKLIDLGNLRPGKTAEETTLRLKAACEMLIAGEIFPLIVGAAHYSDYGQFMAYEQFEKIVTLLNVDARIDISLNPDANLNQRHTHQILMHHPNFLFELSQLGYQRYLVNPQLLNILEKLDYDLLSVGQMREHPEDIEPLVRAADLLSFDLSALKIPYGNRQATPFGLSGEEACQICWYAGMNDTLSSAGFYGLQPPQKRNALAYDTLSVMLWYFLEGFVHRKTEYSFKSNFHIKYIVTFEQQGDEIIFYKSRQSDKWWMEVGVNLNNPAYLNRKRIVPCSYEDYQTACRGVVPDRWIKASGKC